MRKLIFIILIVLTAFVVSGCASSGHCDAYRKSDVTKYEKTKKCHKTNSKKF